jgi:hypothetical protein
MKNEENTDGYGKCDCCLKENVWCNSFLPGYRVDVIKNVCENCGYKVNKPVSFYGKKSTVNQWQVKHVAVGLRLEAEIKKERKEASTEKAATIIGWIYKFLGG